MVKITVVYSTSNCRQVPFVCVYMKNQSMLSKIQIKIIGIFSPDLNVSIGLSTSYQIFYSLAQHVLSRLPKRLLTGWLEQVYSATNNNGNVIFFS
jgi:hypothetical protein